MKQLSIPVFFALCALISCNKSSDESASGDSTVAVMPGHSRWILPLSDYWKNDPSKFVLIIPNSMRGETSLFTSPTDTKAVEAIKDTLQGKILQVKTAENQCGENLFYEVELGPEKKHGWVNSMDALAVDRLDQGTFAIGGRTLKFGTMKTTQHQDIEGDCHMVSPLFFYNDQYLFLIEVSGEDYEETLYWQRENYVSVVNYQPGVTATIERASNIILSWGIPNGSATMGVSFSDDHLRVNAYDVRGVDGDFEGEGEDLPEVGVGNVEVSECVLNNVSLGDCYHVEFSCGDYGSAQLELSAEEKELWQDLSIDKDGETVMNPAYAGKTFIITHRQIEGQPNCGDPSGQGNLVDVLLGFKLK